MRGQCWLLRALALLFCLALSSAAMLSAEESGQDLSQLTIAELVSKAFAISEQLNPELLAQVEDWSALKLENEALRMDLQTARNESAPLKQELSGLKLELETRASESTASVKELSEARVALKTISTLVGSSATSWRSSTADVEAALKEAAMKQRLAEIGAWAFGSVALATTTWAIVETLERKAGR
jgi:hypothetical protein